VSDNLIIFDIDGTLTHTMELDSECYFEAFSGYLPYDKIDKNWLNYKYSTDSGLAVELFEKYTHSELSKNLLSKIKNNFFSLLKEKLEQDSMRCTPVLGVNEVFHELVINMKLWDVAIATGCWKQSALIKLQHIHFPYMDLPIATSDDHIERREIINIAIKRSKQHYSKNAYDQVIYVGDRQWDYRAAQELGIGFIGMGDALRKANLNIPVINDYKHGKLIDLLI